MTWPASQTTLDEGFTRANRLALSLQAQTQSLIDDSLAGPVNRNRLIDLQLQLDVGITEWAAIRVLPGIGAYAQDQFNDPTLNVGVEFTAMETTAASLRDWIFANFPRDAGTGAVLAETVDAGGVRTSLTFTTAQLAGFRTQAQAFVDTIT